LVEVDDRARDPVHGLLGVLDEGWRFAVEAGSLKERRSGVVDDRQPVDGGVAVGVAV
jgi:hypothetical protein